MHQIDDILAKHFSSLQLSEKEKIILSEWKAQNEQEYTTLEQTLNSTKGYQSSYFDPAQGWEKMSERIDKQKNNTFFLKPLIKYSVAATVAILIGISGFYFLKQKSETFIALNNDGNTAKPVELPDGSTVFLAKNTTLEYHSDFVNHREIKLNGQAFFDVFRDEDHPFSIHTNYGDVTVLGTSFNVNTHEKKTQVDVKSGLVALTLGDQAIKLAKNESAWSNGAVISEKTITDPNCLSWKTGQFSFNDTPIDEVVRFLESFFGNVIDYKPVKEEECSFTGSFNNQNIDGIIEALVLSCNLEFSKENNRFILK